MMQAPTSAPSNWRDMYGFSGQGVQKQMTPDMADYWTLNIGNANREQNAVNMMPYVMNPAHVFADGQVPDARAANTANMYSAPTQTQGTPGRQVTSDPMSQILGLVQANPQILPLLLQQLQTQNTSTPGV